MGTELGSIDGRGRPLVSITLPDRDTNLLALLDTGFNGALHCTRDIASVIGVVPQSEPIEVELAGGVMQNAQMGSLLIMWFGRQRQVDVFIAPSLAGRRRVVDGEPVALFGSSLLAPHLVLLDYGAGTVEIEDGEQSKR